MVIRIFKIVGKQSGRASTMRPINFDCLRSMYLIGSRRANEVNIQLFFVKSGRNDLGHSPEMIIAKHMSRVRDFPFHLNGQIVNRTVLQVMVIPQVVATSVKIFTVHSNNLCMIPRDSIAPGTHPQQDVGIIWQVFRQTLYNFGAISLKREKLEKPAIVKY